jgi:hypothetical protein
MRYFGKIISAVALLPHTLQNLAETIDSEVNAAEEVLSHAEVAS